MAWVSTGEVGVGAAVGLDVGVAAAEQLLGALDGEGLDLVVEAAALVVAGAGITFGVLIGQDGAGGLHDGRRDVVLAGDQLEGVVLALLFLLDEVKDLVVGGLQAHIGSGKKERGIVTWQARGG
jgi:hypothetical protein